MWYGRRRLRCRSRRRRQLVVRRVVAPRQPRGGQQIWREISGLEELRELQQLELELGQEVRELELVPEQERELEREVEVRVGVLARPAVMAAGGRLCQVAQRLWASATDDNYFLTFSDRLMSIPPHDRKFVMYWCCIFVYFLFFLPSLFLLTINAEYGCYVLGYNG